MSQEPRYLIGVKYTPRDPWADFDIMIRKANNPEHPHFSILQNSLFIYNENSDQYLNKSTTPGGGNACIRPWREDAPNNKDKFHVYSLGVPTDNVELANVGLSYIIMYLYRHPNINKVFWSSKDGKLGLGIFAGMESAVKVANSFPRLLINMTLFLGFRDVYYLDKECLKYHVEIRDENGGQWFDNMLKFLTNGDLIISDRE